MKSTKSTPQIWRTVKKKGKFYKYIPVIILIPYKRTMTEPTVIVVNNGEEVSRELGKLIEAEAISVLKSPDSVLVIGLSGKKCINDDLS